MRFGYFIRNFHGILKTYACVQCARSKRIKYWTQNIVFMWMTRCQSFLSIYRGFMKYLGEKIQQNFFGKYTNCMKFLYSNFFIYEIRESQRIIKPNFIIVWLYRKFVFVQRTIVRITRIKKSKQLLFFNPIAILNM